jgi:hypothetical protein
VDLKELVNLYLDICEGILLKITFDKSSSDNANQFLFFLSLEQSLNFLADDILSTTSMDLASFSSLNTLSKWDFLSNEPAIKNIIIKEQLSEGFLYDLFETQKKLLNPVNDSIIISNDSINLKKFNLILDNYKRFMFLLRKTIEEC